MADTIRIAVVDSARDSLGRLGQALSSEDPLALKAALEWGWHAVALLAYVRLRPHREEFDAWIREYLEVGDPVLDVERDARWESRQRLSSLELLDLMSEPSLPMLKPEFYQGWQERSSRCRVLRQRVAGIIGASITAAQQERLLTLLAAYHRLVRLPADVTFQPEQVQDALPALTHLLRMLVEPSQQGSLELISEIDHCDEQMSRWTAGRP